MTNIDYSSAILPNNGVPIINAVLESGAIGAGKPQLPEFSLALAEVAAFANDWSTPASAGAPIPEDIAAWAKRIAKNNPAD